MIKWLFVPVFSFLFLNASAAFLPVEGGTKEVSDPQKIQNLIRGLSVTEFEQLTGKKMSGLQKWQYKKAQKKLQKNSRSYIFPERDELTEGFQALPFFGSILTLGLLWVIMLFTARDRNALRWAATGLSVIAIAVSVTLLIASLSGY
jgi:hypothetical protein